MCLQGFEHGAGAGAFRQREGKLVGDGVENVVARERGVAQVNNGDMLGQPFHHYPAEHGFAATDLAADLDDAFVVTCGVEQGVKGGATVSPGKKELRMRRDAKRRLSKPEMF